MSEPEAKKAKLSDKDRQVFIFTKEEEACDRDILVENTVFHIYSATLIENSEYFRVMFTSDFMEKDKKENEISGIEEKEMLMFLSALFEPNKITVKENTIPLLCKVFSFFQATDYLVHFLKEKELGKFSTRNLIKLSEEYGIPELRDAVESSLIAQFIDKFPVTTQEVNMIPEFLLDKYIINSLDFASEFALLKLKEKVEARLSCDYTRNKKHLLRSERKYVDLMIKYELDNLERAMMSYVLPLLNPRYPLDMSLMKPYLKSLGQTKMTLMKETIENFCIEGIDKNKYNTEFLNYAHENKLINLLEAVENILLDKLKNIQDIHDHFFADFCNYPKNYGMDKLKVAVAEFLTKKFQENGEIKSWTIETCSRFSCSCDMTELKRVIEEYLINDFENSRSFKNIAIIFSRIDKLKDSENDGYNDSDGDASTGLDENSIDNTYFRLFRATVTDFLKTVTIDDPIVMAGYEYFNKLDEKQSAVIKAMLKKSESEE